MGNIVSSVFSAVAQRDGRQQVHEVHTDLVGLTHALDYLAAAADNLSTNLTLHATSVGQALADVEIATNLSQVSTLGHLASPTFVYSTVAANVAALRAFYLTATQTQAIFVGDYLSSLTDLQLQNAFGLTAGQVTTLRTNKLTPAANAAATIVAATGA